MPGIEKRREIFSGRSMIKNIIIGINKIIIIKMLRATEIKAGKGLKM